MEGVVQVRAEEVGAGVRGEMYNDSASWMGRYVYLSIGRFPGSFHMECWLLVGKVRAWLLLFSENRRWMNPGRMQGRFWEF